MIIKKIVLSTAAIGFAACNTLAMENREKLMTKGPLEVFLISRNGGVRYVNNQTPENLLRPSILQHIPPCFRFGTKFAIENALAEDKFVLCTSYFGRERVIFGTRDQERCNDAEMLMNIKEILRLMPDPENPNNKDRGGY